MLTPAAEGWRIRAKKNSLPSLVLKYSRYSSLKGACAIAEHSTAYVSKPARTSSIFIALANKYWAAAVVVGKCGNCDCRTWRWASTDRSAAVYLRSDANGGSI